MTKKLQPTTWSRNAEPDPADSVSQPTAKKARRAAQSFRADEVRVVIDIFATLMRGGDAATLAASAAGKDVYAKFVRMKRKLDDG